MLSSLFVIRKLRKIQYIYVKVSLRPADCKIRPVKHYLVLTLMHAVTYVFV